MSTIGNSMQENQHKALKYIAYTLGLFVYVGGILYAETRAFSLFTKTIDAELLPLAIIGLLALGLTAVAAPIAHHFGTAPGVQRIFLDVFYAFDILAMMANAVLDAALHETGGLTTVLSLWKLYVLPALPLICLAGWAIFFALDPAHRKRDMVMAARAATEEVLTSRLIEQMKATDLTDIVDEAARAAAREIVDQTLGTNPLPTTPPTTTLPTMESAITTPEPATPKIKVGRNGRKPEVALETLDPNA